MKHIICPDCCKDLCFIVIYLNVYMCGKDHLGCVSPGMVRVSQGSQVRFTLIQE